MPKKKDKPQARYDGYVLEALEILERLRGSWSVSRPEQAMAEVQRAEGLLAAALEWPSPGGRETIRALAADLRTGEW